MTMLVQDYMIKELLQEDNAGNEMVEILDFMRFNGVPITADQARAMFILKQNGIEDLSNYVFNIRQHMTPTRKFFDLINKITLADRIKGNAKLSNILKANANPANGAMPSTGIKPDGTMR
jgi:flagellar biosynthesis/type III secretory pathway chaperone